MAIKCSPPIICLMGPTAAGKTDLAMALVKQLPCEIISVDSVMIYQGMDIGAAKPSQAQLQQAPHRLIDKLDPGEPYSAGQFRVDALREINHILAAGNIPLLVGGTMLYFRVLKQGMAALPVANPDLRAQLQARGEQAGWAALHAELANIDPLAAARIHCHDSQRIQRALEVYQLTGKTMSAWQAEQIHPLSAYHWLDIALLPSNRAALHERIALRFYRMLEQGLIEEVRRLHQRSDLTPDLPAIRSVGYRQVWAYLDGALTYEAMCDKAITATRQLAKRQMTWLRSWPNVVRLDSDSPSVMNQLMAILKGHFPTS